MHGGTPRPHPAFSTWPGSGLSCPSDLREESAMLPRVCCASALPLSALRYRTLTGHRFSILSESLMIRMMSASRVETGVSVNPAFPFETLVFGCAPPKHWGIGGVLGFGCCVVVKGFVWALLGLCLAIGLRVRWFAGVRRNGEKVSPVRRFHDGSPGFGVR